MNNIVQKQKKHLTSKLLAMLMLLFAFTGTIKADELTVYDGTTTNSYVPVYGFYADAFLRAQYVIPAADLADMNGGTINQLTYYLTASAATAWTGSFRVYMTEVDDVEISAFIDTENATVVYEGLLDATGSTMDVVFDENYFYNGGNLLIGFDEYVTGNYKSVTYAGTTVTGASVQGYSYSGVASVSPTQRNFIPKTTFTYEAIPVTETIIVANPETIDFGYRPNGYWMNYNTFSLTNIGLPGTITSVETDDPYFIVNVETPATLMRNDVLYGEITTGTATAGEINGNMVVVYNGEDMDDQTISVELTATAYDAVSPDVWELAQVVNDFPYQGTVSTDELYKNYNIPGISEDAKDAVYKVTFDEDVLLNAGATGSYPVTAIYPEDFNGFGGPDYDNNYIYDGPEVGPSPKNMWFSYDYTGSNTFFGSSAGGGLVFGYKISAAKLQELGLGNCAITTVEAAAREGSFYDLLILKGGDEPSFDNQVYYQAFNNYDPWYFFDINLDEPQYLGDDENIWIMLYSDSPYAAYCGRYPDDTENAKIWYTLNMSTWYSNTSYTPQIYTRFIELPTGREVTVNLSNMSVIEVQPESGEIAELAGTVNGVSKAQMYEENKAKTNRGNKSTLDPEDPEYQITDMFVQAGTYYIVTASESEDFEVNMFIDDVPLPEQAYIINPYYEENNVDNPYLFEWELGYYTREMQVLVGTDNPPTTVFMDWTSDLVAGAFITNLEHNQIYYIQVNERNNTGVTEGEIVPFSTVLDPVQGFETTNHIFVGYTAILIWNAIESETLLGYNIYMDGGLVNEELITDTYYQITDLDYNPYGYSFNVTAVYAAGESAWSETKYIYVSGDGTVSGYVYEQDGDTPISGATVMLEGYNEFDWYNTYQVTTDEDGYYSVSVNVGYYAAMATGLGYQTVEYGNEITVSYQDEVTGIDFSLDEEFYPVDIVTATEVDPDVLVEWTTFEFAWLEQFENGLPEGWTTIDADGDGFTWDNYGWEGHSGNCISSASYDNEQGPLTPDNYLVTPLVNLDGFFVFWANAHDIDYAAEHFGVAVSTASNDNPEDFTTIQEWTLDGNRDRNMNYADVKRVPSRQQTEWQRYYVDLRAYAGQEGYVAIRHFDSTDQFYINIDDVAMTVAEGGNTVGNRSFDRYRVYRTSYFNDGPYSVENTDLLGEGNFDNLLDDSFAQLETGLYKYGVSRVYSGNRGNYPNTLYEGFDEGFPRGWNVIDADYDGSCWMLGSEASLGYGHGHDGSNDMMISKSFENGGSVCPDNYLVTPRVSLSQFSRFSFWACAQDANYPNEHFGVAVSTGSNEYDWEFNMIEEWTMEAKSQGNWYKYTVDLSSYAGQDAYIAIRHFNNCGQFYLDVDDVMLEDLNAQVERESEIVWSPAVGKDMYLTDGDVQLTVWLNSGDAPEGIKATFKNLTQPEFEDVVVYLDENGYYSFDSFRKGDYEVLLDKVGYESDSYYMSIWEPISMEFEMYETLYAPTNLKVSHSGYVTWDAPQSPNRHFDGYYFLALTHNGDVIWTDGTHDNSIFIPEDLLVDRQTYKLYVYAHYSSEEFSPAATRNWKYMSCDNFEGATNVTAKPMEDGVYMTWEYPEIEGEGNATTREVWDLLNSFEATSGYQYGVASDGENIYTSSWSASSTSMFYKYDMEGNFIEEFNIEGCGQIRDLTYDGQYFYGVALSSTIYCLDFESHTLVSTINTDYGSMRGCTYDPERDGFWVIGNWSGNVSLIDRYGNIQISGVALPNVSGMAYYKDSYGVEYILFANNSDNQIYAYYIADDSIDYTPLYDLNTLPGYISGTSGGCHVGIYNDKVAFYADMQQSPQLISILELEKANEEPIELLGAFVYVNDEYFDFVTEDNIMLYWYDEYNTFSVRVVYSNYDMSCMQYADMINRYWVYTGAYPYFNCDITPSNWYYEGDTCTLSVVTYDGIDFGWWEDEYNGGVVSREATFSFVVTQECSYMARLVFDHYYNDVNLYENNMNVIGMINLEGEYQDNPFLEIGAFCNGECRGHERLKYYEHPDMWLVYLTISGDEGDDITFRLYDNYNYRELNASFFEPFTFEADAVVGTPFEPYVFDFMYNYYVYQDYNLNPGWNWWSTNVEQKAYNGLEYLQYVLGESGEMINSQTAFTQYYANYGWYGSLNSITNESMYKIKTNEEVWYDINYYYARPELHPITIEKGWNFIGYVNYQNLDVNEALANMPASEGDIIKSQYAYANYYEGFGWYGSLNTMEPGKGYMYKSVNDTTVTFFYDDDLRGEVKANLTAENNHWVPDMNAYKENMTIMAVVELNDNELRSDNYELAAFVNGECRGSVKMTYAEPIDRYVAYLTVAGEDAASLSFGLYDIATGAELYSNEDGIMFNADVMAGNPGNPVVIAFANNGSADSGIMVYPNPVANGERVNIVLSSETERAEAVVFNALGEAVSVETLTQSQTSIELPSETGVYTIRIITNNNDTYFRKVVVK